MKVYNLPVGPLDENCIILSFYNQCVIFYPGDESEKIESFIKKANLKPLSILNTHGHFDHIGAVKHLQIAFDIPFYIHKSDEVFVTDTIQSQLFGTIYLEKPKIDGYLDDNMIFNFQDFTIKVLHTPGHTMGGVCFYIERESILISGDTLFYQGIGRADLPGGNFDTLINSIKTKLLTLSDSIKVYPGHDRQTTVGFERKNNPYLS
jgi:glyoxylase-like metal-dependent hydrolase (beta-lactamase superfamily II)